MLLDRKRFGLVLRTFSAKPELVPNQVAKVLEAVERARGLKIENRTLFSRIDVLVSADKRFHDCDCGETAKMLRLKLKAEKIFVHEITHGDIFCSLLNYGVAIQLRDRIDYTMILSSSVASYLNEETASTIIMALERGAKVVGVAIEELSDSIMAGRVANTFAVWSTIDLVTVGAFDLRTRKPRVDDKLVPHLRGWSEEKEKRDGNGEVYYHQAGVEEIPALIRLVELFGPCIAPIKPQGPGVKCWTPPDPVQDPEGYARHLKKMGTKIERQTAHAFGLSSDLSYIAGGVMPAYR